MIKYGLYIMVFVLSLSNSVAIMAEDVIESEGTRIIGDSDMPKALYIVPWKKKSALPTVSSRPITPFINDALSSLNRDFLVFKMKQNEFFQLDGLARPDK